MEEKTLYCIVDENGTHFNICEHMLMTDTENPMRPILYDENNAPHLPAYVQAFDTKEEGYGFLTHVKQLHPSWADAIGELELVPIDEKWFSEGYYMITTVS